MAAVCVRHSDVSGVWASLVCKCLFATVCDTVTHCLAHSVVRRSACVGTVRVAPYTLDQVLALIFSTRLSLETPRCVPTLPLHA